MKNKLFKLEYTKIDLNYQYWCYNPNSNYIDHFYNIKNRYIYFNLFGIELKYINNGK